MSQPVVAPCAPWFEADQFSLCEPGDVRPEIMEDAVRAAEALLFIKTQRLYTGVCTDTWRPRGCTCTPASCGCRTYPRLGLRMTPVIAVTSITIDGVALGADAWRLGDPDDPHQRDTLFRVDGQSWPSCQDIALAPTEPGTSQIVYTWGTPPPPGSFGMGQALACEFLKAWGVGGGGKCRLPRTVTQSTRENVTQAILTDRGDTIANGQTGLPEVDLWLLGLNPSGSDRQPRVVDAQKMGYGTDPTNRRGRRGPGWGQW